MPGETPYTWTPEDFEESGFPEEPLVRRFIGTLRRRIWIFLTVFVIASVVGTIRAFKAPRIYEAVAKVLVERNAPRLRQLEGVIQDGTGWDPEFYATQAQLVKSRSVLEKAFEVPDIRKLLNMAEQAPPSEPLGQRLQDTARAVIGTEPVAPARPWQQLGGYVTSRHVPNTHFIEIHARHGQPKQAATIANAMAWAFKEYHLQRRVEMHGEAFVFLKHERDREEAALLKAQKELQEFREQAHAVSLQGTEEQQPYMKRLTDLNQRLTEIQLKHIELAAQIKALRHVRKANGTTSDQDLLSLPLVEGAPMLENAQKRLAEAENEAALLSETYGPEHPRLQAARVQVSQLRDRIRDVLAQVITSQSNRLEMLRNEEAELQRQYDQQRDYALQQAQEAFTFTRLQNDVGRHRRYLDRLVERVREIDLSSGFVKTNVHIVEKAPVPASPVSPNRFRMIGLGLLAGLALGAGLAFFLEHVDDTLTSPEDVKKLKVPFLGFVPDLQAEEAGSEGAFSSKATTMLLDPNAAGAEAYRHIRTSLFSLHGDGQSRTVVFSSAGPGEGKTTTSANLALAVAQSNKRVLLVDGDFHRPAVHKAFDLTRDMGLSDILTGKRSLSECVRRANYKGTPVDNLHILASGPKVGHPAEVLGSTEMEQFLAAAKKEYDWVLLDTAPILLTSQAATLSVLCDGAVLVVKAGRHNRGLVTRAKEYFESIHAPILGSILNQMHVSRFGRYYSDYYYHSYYRYYGYYHGPSRTDGRDKTTDGQSEPESLPLPPMTLEDRLAPALKRVRSEFATLWRQARAGTLGQYIGRRLRRGSGNGPQRRHRRRKTDSKPDEDQT